MRFVPYPDARALEEAPGYEALLGAWPAFLLHDRVSNRYWSRLYTDFPGFQFLVVGDDERVVAEGRLTAAGTFEADTILAKHDERYMPPPVARAMEEGAAANVVAPAKDSAPR